MRTASIPELARIIQAGLGEQVVILVDALAVTGFGNLFDLFRALQGPDKRAGQFCPIEVLLGQGPFVRRWQRSRIFCVPATRQ